MQHKIGINYKEILKTRKNKKDYPHVGRLKMTVDIERLRAEVQKLLDQNLQDGKTTETTYRLNRASGDKFIKDYEDIIKNYSSITFHKITPEAEELASTITKPLDDYTPIERLKGMIDTSSEFYHPYYDERNYTLFTENATGYIREILESFESQSCRAAVVLLRPGQQISRHIDVGPEHVIRTHIPLWTNKKSTMGFKTKDGWDYYHLPADGGIYAVNTGVEHWATNYGDEERFQLRVCLVSQEDTEDMTPLEPVGFISHEDFEGHPCND